MTKIVDKNFSFSLRNEKSSAWTENTTVNRRSFSSSIKMLRNRRTANDQLLGNVSEALLAAEEADFQLKADIKKKQLWQMRQQTTDWIDNLIEGWFRYDNRQLVTMAVLTFLSMFTRFWSIGQASFVVWDEAHFGRNYKIAQMFH